MGCVRGRARQVRAAAAARTWVAVLAIAAGAWPAAAQAPDPALAKSPALKTVPLKIPSHGVTMDMPARDWSTVPGGLVALVTLLQKKAEASLTLEYELKPLATEPDMIDETFVEVSTVFVTSQSPGATGITARVVKAASQPIVVMDFTRPGLVGTERVRQYVIPMQRHLYRLVCRAGAAEFAKYEPVFAHVAASFVAQPPPVP